MTARPPFIHNEQIADLICRLRTEYGILSAIPVEVEEFAELDLEIELIPFPGLRAEVNADAFISRDFQSILIDNDYYNMDKMRPRVRFSIAHELGHLFLHKDYFLEQCPMATEDEWREFMRDMDDYTHICLEKQANLFAALLLMPADDFLANVRNRVSFSTMTRRYAVSTGVIERRLQDFDVKPEVDRIFLNGNN